MSWFLLALICILGWGFADLFYKKGTDESDPMSHLKIAVWVGLVMGICAVCLLPFSESLVVDGSLSLRTLLIRALQYSPASLCYILSMVIGYAGLRYLELSIVSPVQNASGALSTLCMLLFFLLKGGISRSTAPFSVPELIGTACIVIGMIVLAIVEHGLSGPDTKTEENKKYRRGALALLFPLAYCLFDTIGTAADGIILNEEVGLGLGEIDVLILYGLTFFLAGIAAWIWLFCKHKKPYIPFKKSEIPKGAAAVCEEFGQIFYVYAMAAKPLLAAPMVASYCIVSVILSRLILKEKLTVKQALCISGVILGIVLLGISEGLSS